MAAASTTVKRSPRSREQFLSAARSFDQMLISIFALAAFCFLLERLLPGWRLPAVRSWPWRVVVVNAVQLGVVLLAGVSWERWLSGWSVFHLQNAISPSVGGSVGDDGEFRDCEFASVQPSRAQPGGRGGVYLLLRGGRVFLSHQRDDPALVGYFFQRPEMHRIHHEHGRHENNYGDITWWDMLFGTYENPPLFASRCGFDADKEERLGEMLAFRDVHRRRFYAFKWK